MLMMAEKKAAHYGCANVKEQTGAVSIGAPFALVAKIVGLSIPLRRPARCCPSREAEQEYLDSLSAKKALQEAEGVQDYSEFRKQMGLGK